MMTRPFAGAPTPRYDRHMRRSRLLHVLSETFWVFVLGVICLFVFFVVMGALSPAQAVGVTVAVLILAALWIGHAMWESRHREGRDIDAIRARERRGF
jgi:ABC-type xylose transport system permease subunit